MTEFRYLALAGVLAAFGSIASANASITLNALNFNALSINALSINALSINALTSNALSGNGLLKTGSALGNLNGVTIEAVSTVHH